MYNPPNIKKESTVSEIMVRVPQPDEVLFVRSQGEQKFKVEGVPKVVENELVITLTINGKKHNYFVLKRDYILNLRKDDDGIFCLLGTEGWGYKPGNKMNLFNLPPPWV